MKSKILSRPSLCLVALLVGAPLVLAQTPPEAPAPVAPVPQAEPIDVSMKLDVVSWGDTLLGLQIKSSGKEISCSAKAFEYSKPISYFGSNVMEIRQNPGTNPSATLNPKGPVSAADSKVPLTELEKRRKKDPSILGLALLPAGSTRATVLIAPAPGGTYQTYVIDDDPTKLPLGKLRIHNYCNFPIALRCNLKEKVELKPKETAIVQAAGEGVIYELFYRSEDRWVMQENNRVTVEPTEQVQMVVLKSDASFFTSSDGSRGGFVQTVTLRRNKP
jgi:hypothetical protein